MDLTFELKIFSFVPCATQLRTKDLCVTQLVSNLGFLYSSLSVAKNGDVCISILHEPGEDKFGYEKPEERWLPIHTVETIMISVISMLADPNGDSPANVDAAVSPRHIPSQTL